MADPEVKQHELYEILEQRPPGLLSLMYWVKHHNAYRTAFHDYESLAMTRLFAINQEQQDRVIEISRANNKPLPNESEEEHRLRVKKLVVDLFADFVVHDLLHGAPVFW